MLKKQIIAEINANGQMPIDRYIELCNTHYYSSRDPLGKDGDFTTAPEICQIFGEMIAVWAITKWQEIGAPNEFALVELGAGRGTLMADLLRAAKVLPGFNPQIHIVEISPILREKQREKLFDINVQWHATTPILDIPTIVIANEFFDALPIKQFIGTEERKISAVNGELIFTHPARDIREISPVSEEIMHEISSNYAGGIIIDYGYITGTGDTFQALKAHRHVGTLEHCGDADLTSHVNFSRLAEISTKPCKITTQGEFLLHYGGAIRAKKLGQEADFARLASPEQMGELFKVLTF